MREYTVNWQTFEREEPKPGMHIIVETGKGCVTGLFMGMYNLKAGKVARFAARQGDRTVQVSAKCRWYPRGSEVLKVQNI